MATTTLLALKTLFYRNLGTLWTGTATGGSTTTLIDSTLIDLYSSGYPAAAEGWQVRVTSGSAINDLRQVVEVDKSSGTLRPNRAFSGAVASTNTYELWGNSIYGGQPLTDLFNDVLDVARPTEETQVTIVTGQRFYDITSIVGTKDNFRGAYVRDLDYPVKLPYTIRELTDARVRSLSVSGTYTVMLEIDPLLTLSVTTNQLWVRHAKILTDFSTDASTVEAKYADWLAWRAVLLHAVKMQVNGGDNGRWASKAVEAMRHVKALDPVFIAPAPNYIRHARPQAS